MAIVIKKADFVAASDTDYRTVPDLGMDTLAHAVTDRFVKMTARGCEVFTKQKHYILPQPCKKYFGKLGVK